MLFHAQCTKCTGANLNFTFLNCPKCFFLRCLVPLSRYFAYAKQHFPETLVIYDPVQMGATIDEIATNYYMGNGQFVARQN